MSDAPTQRLPEPPAAPPAASTPPPTGSRSRTALIVIAIVLGVAVIGLVIALLVRGAPAPGPTPTPSASSASPTPSPTPTPTPTQTAAITACTSAQLTVTLGEPDGAAGSTYLPIGFTNSGNVACILSGFPVVSLVDASGDTIGAAAAPDASQSPADITIQPGNGAPAVLKITSAGVVDNCDPQDASGFKIQPPNLAKSVTLNVSGYTGCANGSVNILSIGPVTAG